MSYTPTEWTSGDIISSEKLNKLEAGVEQAIELPDTTGASDGDVLTLDNGEPAWAAPSGGGGGGVLVVTIDTATYTLDKTWQEMYEATFPVCIMDVMDNKIFFHVISVASGVSGSDPIYEVRCMNANDTSSIILFTTNSADGYPVAQMG